MSQHQHDSSPREGLVGLLLGMGRALRTGALAIMAAGTDKPPGHELPPDTRRAQRPRDYRP